MAPRTDDPPVASSQASLDRWRTLEVTRVLDTRVFSVCRQLDEHPLTAEAHEFHVLDCADWVNVIAIRNEQVALIRQYRAGTQTVTLEIPGGMVDPEDTSLEAAARRELREETGLIATMMTFLGKISPNPALQRNACHTFLASVLAPEVGDERGQGQDLDSSELIEVDWVPLANVPALISTGKITHSLVVVAFCWFFGLSSDTRAPNTR